MTGVGVPGAVGRRIAARLVQAGLVVLTIGALSFALVSVLPGDAAFRIASDRFGPDAVSGRAADLVRAELGLDRPWPARLAGWFADLAQGRLGRSLVSGEPVGREVLDHLVPTLQLAGAALLLALAAGPAIGLLGGLRPGSAIDRAGLVGSVAARSLPPFVLGLGLTLLLSIQLGLLPPAGHGGLRELVLPALTLAIGLAAVSSRVTRDAVAAVARTPFYRFARLKGLSDVATARRHGIRNAAIPVVAYLGVQAVYLVEGVVVVESIFAYPGLGHELVHAVIARDVPMVQGAALMLGLLFVAINLGVDLLCGALDPRLRAAR